MKHGELLARISAQLRVKADATWVQSIVKGVLEDDSEAMNILQTILPEQIISRIQVSIMQQLPLLGWNALEYLPFDFQDSNRGSLSMHGMLVTYVCMMVHSQQ